MHDTIDDMTSYAHTNWTTYRRNNTSSDLIVPNRLDPCLFKVHQVVVILKRPERQRNIAGNTVPLNLQASNVSSFGAQTKYWNISILRRPIQFYEMHTPHMQCNQRSGEREGETSIESCRTQLRLSGEYRWMMDISPWMEICPPYAGLHSGPCSFKYSETCCSSNACCSCWGPDSFPVPSDTLGDRRLPFLMLAWNKQDHQLLTRIN